MSSIPNHSGKTPASKLKDYPVIDLNSDTLDLSERTLITYEKSGQRYDYYFSPKPGASRLFVLFCGDALRKKNDPPVFQRWSWAKHFPGHCLYVSDPALYLDDSLGLAWYSGSESFDPLDEISDFMFDVGGRLGVSKRNTILYGSSGGGFAALRMLSMYNELCAVCINPQTSIINFERKHVEKYLKIAFSNPSRDDAYKTIKERVDVLHKADVFKNSRIIYIQNLADKHHYEEHYLPFCKEMGVESDENTEKGLFRRILFWDERGHGKAESQEAFDTVIRIIKEGF